MTLDASDLIPWPYLAAFACMYLAAGCALAGLWSMPGGLVNPDGSRRDRWGRASWAAIAAAWPFFVILWSFNTWRAGR